VRGFSTPVSARCAGSLGSLDVPMRVANPIIHRNERSSRLSASYFARHRFTSSGPRQIGRSATCIVSETRRLAPAGFESDVDIRPLGGCRRTSASWAFEVRSSVRNGDDGVIIPPIIYVSIGAGAVVGGLLGWVVYDAMTHTSIPAPRVPRFNP
jgi:hypothetical protein